jgi:rubrerythrin
MGKLSGSLREILIRIRDHEVYHAEVFSDLLKEEEGKGNKELKEVVKWKR